MCNCPHLLRKFIVSARKPKLNKVRLTEILASPFIGLRLESNLGPSYLPLTELMDPPDRISQEDVKWYCNMLNDSRESLLKSALFTSDLLGCHKGAGKGNRNGGSSRSPHGPLTHRGQIATKWCVQEVILKGRYSL